MSSLSGNPNSRRALTKATSFMNLSSRLHHSLSTTSLGTSLASRSSHNTRRKARISVGNVPEEENVSQYTDEKRIYHAVREAGRFAEGVAAVEVWIMDDNNHLVQPEGGWYRNPEFQPADNDALNKIENKNHPDYVPPPPQIPGAGLAGTLWTSTSAGEHEEEEGDDECPHSPRKGLLNRSRHKPILNLSRHKPINLSRHKAVNLSRHKAINLSKHKPVNIPKEEKSTPFTPQDMEEDPPPARPTLKDARAASKSWTHSFRSSVHNSQRRQSFTSFTPQDMEEDPPPPRPSLKDARAASRSWANSFRSSVHSSQRRQSFTNGSQIFRLSQRNINTEGAALDASARNTHGMLWRDIHSLTVDPDQPTFQRLLLLQDAGFGKATGVRFNFRGQKGIVVYLAKSETQEEILNTHENCSYMKIAADLVGAAVSLSKAKTAILEKKAKDSSPNNHNNHEEKLPSSESDSDTLKAIKAYAGKLKGGDLQPPPPMATKEAILTFLGAFVTLLILARTSERIKSSSDHKYFIVLGPFGALMTLQYGLTMAPASQPRNALFGQTLAVCIALLFSYIPTTALPLWVRVPLATATSIASMTKLGITHPPAGAAALIISTGGFDWVVLPLMLLGNAIAIITSTLINNISSNRQYPTFLHLDQFGIASFLAKCCPASSEEMEDDCKHPSAKSSPSLFSIGDCSSSSSQESKEESMSCKVVKPELQRKQSQSNNDVTTMVTSLEDSESSISLAGKDILETKMKLQMMDASLSGGSVDSHDFEFQCPESSRNNNDNIASPPLEDSLISNLEDNGDDSFGPIFYDV